MGHRQGAEERTPGQVLSAVNGICERGRQCESGLIVLVNPVAKNLRIVRYAVGQSHLDTVASIRPEDQRLLWYARFDLTLGIQVLRPDIQNAQRISELNLIAGVSPALASGVVYQQPAR